MNDFRYNAAKTMLSNPPMWRWAAPYFHEETAEDTGFDDVRWVDTEGLEKLRTEPISSTENLMLDVALNLLEGKSAAEVDLGSIISGLDDGNYARFLEAMAIVRSALKGTI